MPGEPHDDARVIESILTICGLEAEAAQFLARGATSRVWRAQTHTGPVVVRLGDPAAGKDARFDADFGVLQRLHQVDGRVAEPLMVGRGGPAMPRRLSHRRV
jgi:hypothetical protein